MGRLGGYVSPDPVRQAGLVGAFEHAASTFV